MLTRLTIYSLLISWLCGFLVATSVMPRQYVDTSAVYHKVDTADTSVIQKNYTGIARVTCYAPTGYHTASQKVPAYGMVASSDRTIPLGTKVYIEGYGEMVVEDRTAAWVHENKGFTLDIFMEDGCDKNFGVKRLGYIIK